MVIKEQALEELAIRWFQDNGWDYLSGSDIAPDSDYRQVLLQGELREALTRLNPQIPAAVLDDVAHQLGKPDHPSLIQSNRAFHEALVGGMPVEVEINGERRGDRVVLVDFDTPERNRFLVRIRLRRRARHGQAADDGCHCRADGRPCHSDQRQPSP